MGAANILIVEDEPVISLDIKYMLEKEGYQVAGVCNSYDSAIQSLQAHSEIDLCILDIKLLGEKTGIDIGNHIRENYTIPFIYLTSFSDEDTLKQILKTNPQNYLVKPVRMVNLRNAIELGLMFSQDVESKKIEEEVPQFIFVRANESFERLELNSILYIKSWDNYCIIRTAQSKFTSSVTMKEFESMLPEEDFFRVHRSYIVRLDKVERIKHNIICMADEEIPISRSYRSEFFKKVTII